VRFLSSPECIDEISNPSGSDLGVEEMIVVRRVLQEQSWKYRDLW
jgi:hypothetical protein